MFKKNENSSNNRSTATSKYLSICLNTNFIIFFFVHSKHFYIYFTSSSIINRIPLHCTLDNIIMYTFLSCRPPGLWTIAGTRLVGVLHINDCHENMRLYLSFVHMCFITVGMLYLRTSIMHVILKLNDSLSL